MGLYSEHSDFQHLSVSPTLSYCSGDGWHGCGLGEGTVKVVVEVVVQVIMEVVADKLEEMADKITNMADGISLQGVFLKFIHD